MTTAEVVALAMATLILWFTRLLWQRFKEFKALARPTAAPGDRGQAHASVIVPARNEEANLPDCLRALLAQTYSNLDIVVVDDNSTDHTPAIAAEFAQHSQVRTLTAPPPPPGWMGKSHALWQGSKLAQEADWLVFLDADTFAEPDLLEATLGYAEAHQIDLISVMPRLEIASVIAGMVQPVIIAILQIFLPPARSNDPRDPFGYVIGACLGIRRKVYEAVGGHQAICNTLADDVEFGQLVKSAGHRIELVDGRHLALTRMYASLREIWNGWSVSFFEGLGQRWYLLPGALLASLAVIAYYGVTASQGIAAARNGSVSLAAGINGLSVAYLLVFLGVFRLKIAHENGQPGWYAFTYPVGLIVTGGIALGTTVRIVFGLGQEWKGRRYMRAQPARERTSP